jgi:hypothetical protein
MRQPKRIELHPAMSLLLAAAIACSPPAPSGRSQGESKVMSQQLAAELGVVRQHRILFSHHSVGANILSGIERLDAEAGGGQLRIGSLEEGGPGGPALVHVSGGRNTQPKSKIDYFAASIRNGTGPKPDLAFMKLCFVDFDPRTDVGDLFSHYQRSLESLKREHPEIRFAHVTAPLFKRPTDLKSSLRRLLGLEVWEDAANVKRSEFNRRLKEGFPDDPVFDLASAEATGPDGDASTFRENGQSFPSLHPRYTDDGGHLNAVGQRVVGAAAIRFLADALRPRNAGR